MRKKYSKLLFSLKSNDWFRSVCLETTTKSPTFGTRYSLSPILAPFNRRNFTSSSESMDEAISSDIIIRSRYFDSTFVKIILSIMSHFYTLEDLK